MKRIEIKPSQMISFGGILRASYGAIHHFGNPLDLNLILIHELQRLRRGRPTMVTISGRPYKAFYDAYKAMKKQHMILSVIEKCKHCDGAGTVLKKYYSHEHWTGCKIYGFVWRTPEDRMIHRIFFHVAENCDYCEKTGYRQWLPRIISERIFLKPSKEDPPLRERWRVGGNQYLF